MQVFQCAMTTCKYMAEELRLHMYMTACRIQLRGNQEVRDLTIWWVTDLECVNLQHASFISYSFWQCVHVVK